MTLARPGGLLLISAYLNRNHQVALCFAGQAAPGAFENLDAIAPNSLSLEVICVKLWNSKK